MATRVLDLWDLVQGKPQIDPNDLAEALCQEACEPDRDYRTRLLIRDGIDALRNYWGELRFARWLEVSPAKVEIERICHEEFDKIGFPSIQRRLMDKTSPETIRQYLEQLGQGIRKDISISIAGSVALILPEYLHRHTDGIDIVDEVPEPIRTRHQLLQTLEDSYGLKLGHGQGHYFPTGWNDRVHSFGDFGRLRVYLVDVYDVFLSKLFSKRQKDIDDMRILLPQIEKDMLIHKLKETTQSFLASQHLAELAQNNWRILYGENLPS